MLQEFFACLQFPTVCGEIISEFILLHISILLGFHKLFMNIHTEIFIGLNVISSVVISMKL